jgi:dolichyl-phosphate-mannose--protein O-mannosyl transferase
LPEWGFQQYEVVTDRTSDGAQQAIWVIDELTVPKPHPSKNESRAEEEKEVKEQFLQDRQPRSLNATANRHTHHQLSFWDKYFEMQVC